MKKIAFVIDSLYNSGGMELSTSIVAGGLTDCYDVTMITGLQCGRHLFYPLNDKVRYIDLDVYIPKCHIPIFSNWRIKADYKRKLSKFLTCEHFDYVVCLGGITEYFLPSLKDGSKKIFWFKFEIDIFKIWSVKRRFALLRKLESDLQKKRMIANVKRFDKVVVLTDHDEQQWRKYTDKAKRIYNPITLASPQVSDCTNKRVIAVGRLDYVKGYDMLIDVWVKVNKKHPDWKLTIFGTGKDRAALAKQIEDLGLEKVVILPGATKHISEEYAKSSIFVSSAREEGFGNVMTEAEASGLPVVAFDCPYGPREIIRDGYNGYLVPLNDKAQMAERILSLIEDSEKRMLMGKRSLEVVTKFSLGNIINDWKIVFNDLK